MLKPSAFISHKRKVEKSELCSVKTSVDPPGDQAASPSPPWSEVRKVSCSTLRPSRVIVKTLLVPPYVKSVKAILPLAPGTVA